MNEKAGNELLIFVNECITKAREANQYIDYLVFMCCWEQSAPSTNSFSWICRHSPLCLLQTGGGL